MLPEPVLGSVSREDEEQEEDKDDPRGLYPGTGEWKVKYALVTPTIMTKQ